MRPSTRGTGCATGYVTPTRVRACVTGYGTGSAPINWLHGQMHPSSKAVRPRPDGPRDNGGDRIGREPRANYSARRERPTPFDMPQLKVAADARDAMGAIVAAVADGELTPDEAMTLGKLVADFVAIDADTEVERRMRERKKSGPLSGLTR